MIANKTLLLLPGDGIGPEVMAQAKRVLHWLQDKRRVSFEITEDLVGGASIDVHGVPITEATMVRALAADAVLFGSVGGPQWDGVSFDIRPEAALLRLRKDLGVFANLRPAKVSCGNASAGSISANRAASRHCRMAPSGASIPRFTRRMRSSVSAAWRSTWRASATAPCAAWRRRM
jgi:3-isopropylmalate dehydrogenase